MTNEILSDEEIERVIDYLSDDAFQYQLCCPNVDFNHKCLDVIQHYKEQAEASAARERVLKQALDVTVSELQWVCNLLEGTRITQDHPSVSLSIFKTLEQGKKALSSTPSQDLKVYIAEREVLKKVEVWHENGLICDAVDKLQSIKGDR